MKKWNAPEMEELNISNTENGFFSVNWEGPFDIFFGDYGNKSDDNKSDSTPDTDTLS